MIAERLLDPNTINIEQDGDSVILTKDGQSEPIDQIVRCFPFSTPNEWISFRNSDGHEIGLLNTTTELDETARQIVEARLKERYYIPTILRIEQIETTQQGTTWQVETDEGIQTFSIRGERSVNISEFPKVVFSDAITHQRFTIPNYTALDRSSQHIARAHLSIGRRGGRGGGRHFR